MKTLNYFLLLIGFGIILTSCGKDEDISSSKIAGIWLAVHEKGYEKNGNTKYEFEYSYPDNCDPEATDVGGYVKFEKNGNYSYSLNEAGKYEFVGKWEYKDDKILLSILDYDDGEYITIECNVLKFTSNELVMEAHVIDGTYENYSKKTLQKVE